MPPLKDPPDRPSGVPADHPAAAPAPPTEGAGFVMPPLLWGQASLSAAAGAPRPWLWHGYLAPGAVTLLTSQWKTGKTTLAAVLVARLKTGGMLAGLPLAAGRAVVVSEESTPLSACLTFAPPSAPSSC